MSFVKDRLAGAKNGKKFGKKSNIVQTIAVANAKIELHKSQFYWNF